MLRADPELARKFKEIEDRKKRMNSMMKKYGGKTGDEIDKMKKEEVEQVDERNKENKVKKNAYVSSIIQKKLHPSVLPSLKYGRRELKKEEVEQVDERNKENAEKRKTMDASRGASFKAKGYSSPAAEPQHKGSQAHNKMIGRAIRRMSREVPK
jgi:hypothetical protein